MTATVEAPTRKYTQVIARMRSVRKNVAEERLRASEQVLIDALDAKLSNLDEAIELFSRAEKVPAVRTQFGAESGRGLTVILPPGIAEFRFKPMRFNHYVYVTDEPVEICYLRDLIEAQGKQGSRKRIPGLREMPVGLVAAISTEGTLINYYPPEMIEELGRAKILKSQIG